MATVAPMAKAATAAAAAADAKVNHLVAAQLTKTKICAMFKRGACRDTQCRFAHSQHELRTPPDLTKTSMCRAFARGRCRDADCKFAHGEKDLRVTESVYRTQICHYFQQGNCKKGDLCRHAHRSDELRYFELKTDDASMGTPSAQAGPSNQASPAQLPPGQVSSPILCARGGSKQQQKLQNTEQDVDVTKTPPVRAKKQHSSRKGGAGASGGSSQPPGLSTPLTPDKAEARHSVLGLSSPMKVDISIPSEVPPMPTFPQFMPYLSSPTQVTPAGFQDYLEAALAVRQQQAAAEANHAGSVAQFSAFAQAASRLAAATSPGKAGSDEAMLWQSPFAGVVPRQQGPLPAGYVHQDNLLASTRASSATSSASAGTLPLAPPLPPPHMPAGQTAADLGGFSSTSSTWVL